MTRKEEIKKYELLLQKYIDSKDYVKIYRTICNKEESLSGFILKMSKHFLLIQLDHDFTLDGYAIIRKNDFDSIRCNKFDKTRKKIFKAENILETSYGITTPIPITNWQDILQSLKKWDYHIIVENINKDELDFFIGPIKRINAKSLSIHNYDPTGKLDKKPTIIKFDTISTIQFGDKYSTTFRKYLR